jgi:hypothetical protein
MKKGRKMNWTGMLTALLFSLLSCGTTCGAADLPMQKPSILFCSPGGTKGGMVNMTYIKELNAKGFEVDYTEELDEFFKLSPERIKKYNVLVIYLTPDAFKVCHQNQRTSPELVESFKKMIDDYVAGGGGVLLIPDEGNAKKQMVGDLTSIWGVQIASERIEESNPDFTGKLTNASYDIPLSYTDNILPSPVSGGITGIWYPSGQHYNGSCTDPLVLDKDWQLVFKGSKTSKARAFGSNKNDYNFGDRIAGVPCRNEGVTEPDLFAIREYRKGRIALVSMMPQYSMGSGTQFIFNREVLSKGIKDKKSDFGQLLENTYRWLAEPSLKSGAVGGYSTRESALIPVNYRKLVREFNDYTYWFWEYDVMQWHIPPKNGQIFKGLIGAKSAFSDGKGTVQEYKDAASKAGLDFVIFMEDFESLTKEKYEQLVAECAKLSDGKVKLIPGYAIKNNIGNHTLCIAEDGYWPKDEYLAGPNKTLLNIQPEESPGVYTGYNTGSSFNFHIDHCNQIRNIGYFNWAGSGNGMRMPTQRNCSLAAVKYYKDGKLVEDMTDDYLTTLQSTMPPTPVSVNEVNSPDALIKEVKSGNALTYAQARSVKTLMQDALRWSGPYDGMNVFLSDGPIIQAWPTCYRPMTFGAEEFVTAPALMESPLHVTSQVGLKEIVIYNGRDVFRRFSCDGEKDFNKKLILDGTVMKNLVVIAEDVKGGKAVSFARRSYKYDVDAIAYCADHFNDYGGSMMKSFHGPGPLPVASAPELPIDIAGFTWDGGPPSRMHLIEFQESRPTLVTDKGTESGSRFNQYPITETTDEGVVAVASRQDETFPENVKAVANPWHTFGPRAETKLMDYTLRFRNYFPPSIGPGESDLAIRGMRYGMRPCVFRDEITFKQDCTVKDLTLLRTVIVPKASPTFLVIGRKPDVVEKVINGETMEKPERFQLKDGDWFAAYSTATANTHVMVVKGSSVILAVSKYVKNPSWLTVRADIADKQVRKGDTFTFELISLNTSVDVAIHSTEAVQRLRAYLAAPEKMQVLRGAKTDVAGLVDFEPKDYAIEIVIPKPSTDLNMTLPLRISHLNRNWTAGLFQKKGYVKGTYGTGENRYRGVGLDFEGSAHIPLYVDKSETTHILAGHPIVADECGKNISINVIHLFDNPHQWHVSVNNLTDKPITTKLKQAMELPGLDFEEREVTLGSGEYRTLATKGSFERK